MLKGKSLVELATAVQAQAESKVDIVADTRDMTFSATENRATLVIGDPGNPQADVGLTSHALNQLTDHVGIPAKYAKVMQERAPELLERNVQHWLTREPSMRMVRTINGADGGIARAFLSNRYQRIENDRVLASVLPELMGYDVRVVSSELTDTRMYLKFIFPKMEGEVGKGDVVQYGFILANSEIGLGAFSVSPFVMRLVCLNGLTLPKEIDDARMRKTHLGSALSAQVDYYAEETIKADDTAMLLKLRDTMRAYADKDRWNAVLDKMRAANNIEVVDPIATVGRVASMLVLPKTESDAVLTNFLRDNATTQWGLVNAITAVANKADSYDRACELEQMGGRILTLPASDFRVLAKAA